MKSEFPETTPKNIDVIEPPPMPVECESKTNVVKGIWPHMSVIVVFIFLSRPKLAINQRNENTLTKKATR